MKTFLTLIAAAACCAPAFADEVDTAMKNLPPAVQKAMQELVGKGKISKTVKETEPGRDVIYEVSYSVGKTLFEAEISEKGKVIVVDEQISLEQAPAPVRATIEEQTKGAKIIKIEKATEGKKVFYECEFKKGGKELEVKVAPSGKLIHDEEAAKEGKEPKGEEKN